MTAYVEALRRATSWPRNREHPGRMHDLLLELQDVVKSLVDDYDDWAYENEAPPVEADQELAHRLIETLADWQVEYLHERDRLTLSSEPIPI